MSEAARLDGLTIISTRPLVTRAPPASSPPASSPPASSPDASSPDASSPAASSRGAGSESAVPWVEQARVEQARVGDAGGGPHGGASQTFADVTGDGWSEEFRAAGAEVHRFPTLEIAWCSNSELVRERERASDADIAVFVSPRAVDSFLRDDAGHHLLSGIRIGAVGAATAARLREAGLEVEIAPSAGDQLGFSTEALLAHPGLGEGAVLGKKLVIVRGYGGRERLADVLRSRGAQVHYAQVYRRLRPVVSAAARAALLARDETRVVTVTSEAGLRNLWAALLGGEAHEEIGQEIGQEIDVETRALGKAWLAGCSFVVVSKRLHAAVKLRLPDAPVAVAERSSARAVIAALANTNWVKRP